MSMLTCTAACGGCGVDTFANEYYMIQDALWRAVSRGALYLCIDCVERRLGRTLVRRSSGGCRGQPGRTVIISDS